MVLFAVTTGRRAETDLLTRGLGHVFPEAWQRFRDGVPRPDRDGDLAEEAQGSRVCLAFT